ncbi:hypothetical protein M3Y97_00108600 [Aphelenchoides bicaudatus]|nr:hypothetical protein M3Y97_00108600 [Aphelenchoides bicaudatus]
MLFPVLTILLSTLTLLVNGNTLSPQTEFSCYNGYARNVKLLQIEQCTKSPWCLKIVDSDQAFQFKSCDPDDLCSSFGNRCGKAIIDLEKVNLTGLLGPPDKMCCCNQQLCNASQIVTPSFTILVLSIVYLTL